jgi:16S rRNA (uracil1498-N3)-methyltransferase
MSDTPLFFMPQALSEGRNVALPEETARHIGQVLRMTAGEEILLTDGLGRIARCRLTGVSKKRIDISIDGIDWMPRPRPALHLAIAFTKNASRNEWLLEKATELGVQHITPLITARSIRERIRHDRWQAILVSAMLQSRQCWLPVLREPMPLEAVVGEEAAQKVIAHCIADEPRAPITEALKTGLNALVFIGPEGDFTPAEVTLAKAAGAIPVSLGANRLRTETAALGVITYYYLTNYAV